MNKLIDTKGMIKEWRKLVKMDNFLPTPPMMEALFDRYQVKEELTSIGEDLEKQMEEVLVERAKEPTPYEQVMEDYISKQEKDDTSTDMSSKECLCECSCCLVGECEHKECNEKD